ncbi:hypothetical protein NLJ89_g3304 [Agrocybe chaxingu]|uniref:DUF5648 domain-containing protein n=1 Tax=Agrocybe chaxingu TaxID=84603 RepID=A0A9W8MYD9_9AGAR|nr:hypothetical protein NLJ89_g3304 [Agrocybe chaxingu]
MKTASFALFILTAVTQALAAATGAQSDADRALACASPSTAAPLLRGYNGNWRDHFYTADRNEMNNAVSNIGYTAEGTAAYVFPGTSGSDGTVPFYRLWNPTHTDHFYTTTATEVSSAVLQNGYEYEGIAGYIYQNANCGGVPLFRLYSGSSVDHFYTTSASERDNAIRNLGYNDEGVSGYVLPV